MAQRNRRARLRRPVVEVNLPELDGIVEAATERAISSEDAGKLRTAIHAMARLIPPEPRTSEKTAEVVPSPDEPGTVDASSKPKRRGHGRNGADAYSGATRVPVKNPDVTPGTPCTECPKGRLYPLSEPRAVVRLVGATPIQCTIYEGERYRCNCCGLIVEAPMPEGIGDEKYDETVASAIAMLKYRGGFPFYRLDKFQALIGVPMPAGTQWELVEQAAALLKPAHQELQRMAAQGQVLGNDDTRAKILDLKRAEDDERSGTFTTGIVSQVGDRQIVLYFTGPQHAGENTDDLLKLRAEGLDPPILMSDALARNLPKQAKEGVEILWANCIAHGRRHFVDVVESFPDECRFVLGPGYNNDSVPAFWREEHLGEFVRFLKGRDASVDTGAHAGRDTASAAHFGGMGILAAGDPAACKRALHQERSAPVMAGLHAWMTGQLEDRVVEENSGLGKALRYMLKHWDRLTLFLRAAGAPLDNNRVERALKTVVLHRKNAYFFLNMNGAQVGDLFMSLIQTCELNSVNAFDYLTELQRHADRLAASPADWMPWTYRNTLARA